jgi:3-methyladenine DNA glycosylase AlkC
MASGYSLKDQLFNLEKTRYLAGLFAGATPDFLADRFETDVMAGLLSLELKARITWIAEVLGQHLQGPLPEVAPILLTALPPPLDPAKSDDDFGDFIFAPLGEFVVARGLQHHPDLALDLLAELTQRFSMEWAIRPFLNQHQALTMARLQDWMRHPSYHVRRLVSEGTRPRLPWGQGVALALTDPLPLLDHLHSDPTRYVTRSVANHLNDIAKKDPDLVLERLEHWQGLGAQQGDELAWLTTHACRGLVKAGHGRALRLLGFDPDAAVSVKLALNAENVRIGDALEFGVEVLCATDVPVIVDYIVIFHRPGGKSSQKVFKLKKSQVKGGKLIIDKRHVLKGDATTFKLHPGTHHLQILVNGQVHAQNRFELLA